MLSLAHYSIQARRLVVHTAQITHAQESELLKYRLVRYGSILLIRVIRHDQSLKYYKLSYKQ